jgi:hypothetical protein
MNRAQRRLPESLFRDRHRVIPRRQQGQPKPSLRGGDHRPGGIRHRSGDRTRSGCLGSEKAGCQNNHPRGLQPSRVSRNCFSELLPRSFSKSFRLVMKGPSEALRYRPAQPAPGPRRNRLLRRRNVSNFDFSLLQLAFYPDSLPGEWFRLALVIELINGFIADIE